MRALFSCGNVGFGFRPTAGAQFLAKVAAGALKDVGAWYEGVASTVPPPPSL